MIGRKRLTRLWHLLDLPHRTSIKYGHIRTRAKDGASARLAVLMHPILINLMGF